MPYLFLWANLLFYELFWNFFLKFNEIIENLFLKKIVYALCFEFIYQKKFQSKLCMNDVSIVCIALFTWFFDTFVLLKTVIENKC